jgi:hypothetical protein
LSAVAMSLSGTVNSSALAVLSPIVADAGTPFSNLVRCTHGQTALLIRRWESAIIMPVWDWSKDSDKWGRCEHVPANEAKSQRRQ